MALIEMEFLKAPFCATVGLVVRAYAAVPFPALPSLGADRLMSAVEWQGDPVHETDLAGLPATPGTLIFRSKVRVTHVSLAELHGSLNALGTTTDGIAWILIAPELGKVEARMMVRMIAFAVDGGARTALDVLTPLGSIPIDSPAGLTIVRLAVIASEDLIVLRFATAPFDDVLAPPANRLPNWLASPSGGGLSNWLLHLPSSIFVDMVAERLGVAIGDLPTNTVLEQHVATSWQPVGSGWGVRATSRSRRSTPAPASSRTRTSRSM